MPTQKTNNPKRWTEAQEAWLSAHEAEALAYPEEAAATLSTMGPARTVSSLEYKARAMGLTHEGWAVLRRQLAKAKKGEAKKGDATPRTVVAARGGVLSVACRKCGATATTDPTGALAPLPCTCPVPFVTIGGGGGGGGGEPQAPAGAGDGLLVPNDAAKDALIGLHVRHFPPSPDPVSARYDDPTILIKGLVSCGKCGSMVLDATHICTVTTRAQAEAEELERLVGADAAMSTRPELGRALGLAQLVIEELAGGAAKALGAWASLAAKHPVLFQPRLNSDDRSVDVLLEVHQVADGAGRHQRARIDALNNGGWA